jgi:sugar phosphate isomerase/epimerase
VNGKRTILIIILCGVMGWAWAIPGDGSEGAKSQDEVSDRSWPFFAFCIGTHDEKNRTPAQQAAMLKELGYAGCGHLELPGVERRAQTLSDAGLRLFQVYVTMDMAKEVPVDEERIAEILPSLEPHQTHLALMIQGGTPSDSSLDERVAALTRQLADMSRPYGVKVVLYPHTKFWLETSGDAVRVAKKVGRPGEVGIMFNLSHWMKSDPQRDLRHVLAAAEPWLMAVSLSGSDTPEQVRTGEGEWIQPLDQGSYDIGEFIQLLRETGFSGPVGLQCWGIRGDARVHLQRSMAEWKRVTKKYPTLFPD